MRIALLGSTGQLGRDLQTAVTNHEIIPFTRERFDVTDHRTARATLMSTRADVIVNTTAYHRVDDCETEPELAYATNALAVLNLVRVANDLNAMLVHFSTDYVFDGRQQTPYREDSPPMPLSVYGNSKLSGEYLVRSLSRRYMVIRTSGLYGKAGSRGKGGNFVETMLKKAREGVSIRVVADQVLTPTPTLDLARQIAVLLDRNDSGLYHATSEGACSWYEFAKAIFELAGIPADLTPTTSDLYKTPAIRPRYSVLENGRLKELGINVMRHWREGLAEYLA
jgi:dTDP-4-dehydrorhamnose reductase